MITLIVHYRELFAWLGLAGVLVIGIGIGFIIAVRALRSWAVRSTAEGLAAERQGLLTQHAADGEKIGELRRRLVGYKVRSSALRVHLARAVEELE